MSCLDENRVVSLLDGSMDASERAGVEAHLVDCAACQDLVAILVQSSIVKSENPQHTIAGSIEIPIEAPWLSRGERIGRYVIDEPIGSGAMGIVFAAHDPELDRKVALKLLRAQTDSPARLLYEAQALAKLSHPNVIAVYDVGTYGDQVFMAMEFAEGETLRAWMLSKKRDWKESLAVVMQAGLGLAVAHEAGLIHRDFKPDNVIVSRDGRARVVDFGLARGEQSAPVDEAAANAQPHEHEPFDSSARTMTRTGTILGTPAYMSPEQHRGDRADARSDQFAFAVTLFEALYGERPFAGSTRAEIISQIESASIRSSATRRVPGRLRRAIARGLRKDPAERYESMRALLSALQDAGKSRAVVPGAIASTFAIAAIVAFGVRSGRATAIAAPSTSTPSSSAIAIATTTELPKAAPVTTPPIVTARPIVSSEPVTHPPSQKSTQPKSTKRPARTDASGLFDDPR